MSWFMLKVLRKIGPFDDPLPPVIFLLTTFAADVALTVWILKALAA